MRYQRLLTVVSFLRRGGAICGIWKYLRCNMVEVLVREVLTVGVCVSRYFPIKLEVPTVGRDDTLGDMRRYLIGQVHI